MNRTVLLVPLNDPEAVMIYQIAQAVGIQLIRSSQPHGANLDKEPDIVSLVRDGGWDEVVIVEMPGPKTEAKLKRMGKRVVLIDHHHYTELDRATDPKTGKLLPSSLEQFLKHFRITDAVLRRHGFDVKLVRGIGIMDRGFVWALREEGYKEKDIHAVLAYQRTLMSTIRIQKNETRKEAIARRAWKARKTWNGYLVIQTASALELRSRVSLFVALEIKKPTPLIIVEKGRGLIYVQESPQAMELFKTFGGFTFGLDRCWGHRNEKGKRTVSLADVKRVLSKKTLDKKGKEE